MFPIKDEELSLTKIADYWAREIKPKATQAEILRILEKSFFIGKLQSVGSPDRLQLLKAMFKSEQDEIVFIMEGETGPTELQEREGGTTLVDLRPRVRLPSPNPDSWSIDSCSKALITIAEEWGDQPMPSVILPLTGTIHVSRIGFTSWVVNSGYKMPKFWGRAASAVEEKINGVRKLGAPDKNCLVQKQKVTDAQVLNLIKDTIWGGEDDGRVPSQKEVQDIAKKKGIPGARKEIAWVIEKLKNKKGMQTGPGRPRKNQPE